MRLMLMRHAKTKNGQDKEDFHRMLTDTGKKQASQAADFLYEYQIDKILISHVKRAMQTSSIINEKLPTDTKELEMVSELYEGDAEAVINLITSQEDRNKYLLVIGHNPFIYNVAISLSNSNSDKYNELIATSMPTARIVIIEFRDIDSWKKILTRKGDIIGVFTPV